jgi:bifunctional non-homologous end joining protein LigD
LLHTAVGKPGKAAGGPSCDKTYSGSQSLLDGRQGDPVRIFADEKVSCATVSMPLAWTQVKADLDPKRFTIRTVSALLAKSNAWKDYCDALRPLEPAIKKLSKVKQAA